MEHRVAGGSTHTLVIERCDPRIKPQPEILRVWANKNLRHARILLKAIDDGAQSLLVDILAKKYADGYAVRQRASSRHRGIDLSPTMNEDAIHAAALFHVCLSRRFAMHQRQIIRESRDGSDGHAVRDENDRHTASFGRQIESNPVRVAVTRHDCQTETTASEKIKVARVVADEFDDAERPEEFTS